MDTGSETVPQFIFDCEIHDKIGEKFINYSRSHFEMWDKLAEGKYKNYDCYHFPRGRVLYNCETGLTHVYTAQKILDRIEKFEERLKGICCLNDLNIVQNIIKVLQNDKVYSLLKVR